MTDKTITEILDFAFQAPPAGPIIIHCTLEAFTRLAKINRIATIAYFKDHATPLEHPGWYEVTIPTSDEEEEKDENQH